MADKGSNKALDKPTASAQILLADKSNKAKSKKAAEKRSIVKDNLKIWQCTKKTAAYVRDKESFWQRMEKRIIGERSAPAAALNAYEQLKKKLAKPNELVTFDLDDD